jgi:hypothetical protein
VDVVHVMDVLTRQSGVRYNRVGALILVMAALRTT